MDFFERFFHISLDGGNGLAEFAFVSGLFALTILATLNRLPGILKAIERLRGGQYEQGQADSKT
jgi:hypothetical protein